MAAAVRPGQGLKGSNNFGLLGPGTGVHGRASWFQPEILNNSEFSVESYVAELRQHAPLEALSEELEKYLAALKAKVREFTHCILVIEELKTFQYIIAITPMVYFPKDILTGVFSPSH